jgi:hypothetical protein
MPLPSDGAVAFLVKLYEMTEGEPLSPHGSTGEHWDCMMRAEQRCWWGTLGLYDARRTARLMGKIGTVRCVQNSAADGERWDCMMRAALLGWWGTLGLYVAHRTFRLMGNIGTVRFAQNIAADGEHRDWMLRPEQRCWCRALLHNSTSLQNWRSYADNIFVLSSSLF